MKTGKNGAKPPKLFPILRLVTASLVLCLLTILAAIVLFPLLAARYNERLAFLGVCLLLFTPITLIAIHYYNMDTFAGGMWPLIGGSLLLWYATKKGQGHFTLLLLFATGFVLGWAVAARITNILILGVCGVYFLSLLGYLPFSCGNIR